MHKRGLVVAGLLIAAALLIGSFSPPSYAQGVPTPASTDLGSLFNQAATYLDQGRYADAQAYYARALQLSQQQNYDEGILYAAYGVGLALKNQADPAGSIPYFEQALTATQSSTDPQQVSAVLHNLAGMYEDTDQDATAARYYEQAMTLWQGQGDTQEANRFRYLMALALYRAGDYDRAVPEMEALTTYYQQVGDGWGVGEMQLYRARMTAALGQTQAAAALYAQALATAQQADDTFIETEVLIDLSNDATARQDYAALEPFNERLIPLLRADPTRSRALMISLSQLGVLYQWQSRYTEAEDAYDEALTLAQQTNDLEYIAFNATGLSQMSAELGRRDASLRYAELALDASQQSGNSATILEATIELASAFGFVGRLDESQALLEASLDSARSSGDSSTTAVTLLALGELARVRDQFGAALRYYLEAVAVLRGDNDAYLYGQALVSLATAYDQQRRWPEAFATYQEALTVVQAINDREQVARIQRGLAIVLRNQGRNADALPYLDEALATAQAIQHPNLTAEILAERGLVHANLGETSAAQTDYQQALDIATAQEHGRVTWLVTLRLGDLAAAQGDTTAARAYYEDAAMSSRASGVRDTLVLALFGLGRLHDLTGNTAAALAAYQEAVEVTNSLYDDAALDEAIRSLASQFESRYPIQRLAYLQAEQGDLPAALATLEQGRAILARAELSQQQGDFRAAFDDPTLLDTEADLRQGVLGAQTALDALRRDPVASAADIQAADAALTDARRAYDQHLERMQLQGGYLARSVSREVSSLADIQAALPADTSLLLYSVGDEQSVAFIVTATRLEAVVLDVSAAQIEELVAAFNANRSATAALYDALIGPLADKLTTSRLMISPDGALNYVPFAALQAPDGSYLIDHYAVSMIASGTTLVLLNDRAAQSTPNPTTPALVMAQPSAAGLSRLQNARREALEVGALLGVEANINATEADLRADVAGAGVLHISAHATLDPFAPLYSVIHLGEGGSYDGRLEVREIYELDLSQTTLVILSGCETGSGGDGENFGLLNRAFLGAGASQVVASLWSVDDAATATLITNFVAAWQTHDNAADALQAAMLATREQYPAPYYWAAFTLNGRPD